MSKVSRKEVNSSPFNGILPVYVYICWKTNNNTADILFNSTGFRKCMFTCLTWN